MQQQQQPANYDLLAVFTEEAKADAAVAKLHKEGFGEEEVYQLESGTVGSGQFRDHGPNRQSSAGSGAGNRLWTGHRWTGLRRQLCLSQSTRTDNPHSGDHHWPDRGGNYWSTADESCTGKHWSGSHEDEDSE